MKTTSWLLFALFLLGSCATATYRHPTKSTNTFERDRLSCEVLARKKLAAKSIT